MEKYKEPKPGDKRVYCTVCTQDIYVLSADPKGKVKVVDNGKTIPKHYCFGIDMSNLGNVSWVCEGSYQQQVTYVYQPILWTKDGKSIRYGWKPKGWKSKPKKERR